jgi:adenylylsulfate kinase
MKMLSEDRSGVHTPKTPEKRLPISSSDPLICDRKKDILQQRGLAVWFSGLSGAGKSTLASRLEKRLTEHHNFAINLDGDELRMGLNRGLGFSDADRTENLRRAAEIAKLLTRNGVIVLCSFITPKNAMRQMIREILPWPFLLEVYLKCPYSTCEQRDIKGLYVRAKNQTLPNFSGLSSAFEEPDTRDGLVLNTENQSIDECVAILWRAIEPRVLHPPLGQEPST